MEAYLQPIFWPSYASVLDGNATILFRVRLVVRVTVKLYIPVVYFSIGVGCSVLCMFVGGGLFLFFVVVVDVLSDCVVSFCISVHSVYTVIHCTCALQ